MNGRVKQIIAVDCDDVVANVNDAVRLFVNEVYETNHTAEDYRITGEYQHYWERIWGTPDGKTSDRLERFIASGRMHHLEPIPGALECLEYLKHDYEIVMVTARSPSEVEATHAWLNRYAPDVFKNVTFTHLWDVASKKATKAEICQALGATYLIDDNYTHCQIASGVGIQALLFGDYGWNRARPDLKNMIRVNSWSEVREYFDGR
jgi:FMN phosphatase YigB (HAD superfamily)